MILQLSPQRTGNANDITGWLAICKGGKAVTLRLERDNDSFDVTVRTGDRARYHKYGSD